MQLKTFSVRNLFGIFNHKIEFDLQGRITIVHAPNGYGKTVMLKMIAGFFSRKFSIFQQVQFKEIDFVFESNKILKITQKYIENRGFSAALGATYNYKIRWLDDKRLREWDSDGKIDKETLGRNLVDFELYLPMLRRVGNNVWRDIEQGDIIASSEIVERYGLFLPPTMRASIGLPDWLEAVTRLVPCRLIETQRLIVERRPEAKEKSEVPAVKAYARELSSAIRQLLANSASLSQTIDQSFPTRILERMRRNDARLDGDTLRAGLAELQLRRERLVDAGILDRTTDTQIVSHEVLDNSTRLILEEYLIDSNKKLDNYDEMLNKIDLFKEIVNDRFEFKKISILKEEGMIFHDLQNKVVPIEGLSSGEQHEIVMLYDLLFKTQNNTLVLVDEPELSLHIRWQKRFMSDIRRIIGLTGIDVLLCTHSPQIIGSDMDLVVHLRGPRDAN